MTADASRSAGPPCTTQIPLRDWAQSHALVAGEDTDALTIEALADLGVAEADLRTFSRTGPFADPALARLFPGPTQERLFPGPMIEHLIELAQIAPNVPVRSGLGWLLITLGDRRDLDFSWRVARFTGDLMDAWTNAMRAMGRDADLTRDWLFVAAGLCADEVAPLRAADPSVPVDEAGLRTLAALRGVTTPA